MAVSRQEYLSRLLCPPPGNLPNPGIEPASLVSPALADEFFTTSATWEAPIRSRSGSQLVAKPKPHREQLVTYSHAKHLPSVHPCQPPLLPAPAHGFLVLPRMSASEEPPPYPSPQLCNQALAFLIRVSYSPSKWV